MKAIGFVKNSLGMSLVEIMMAVAISGGLALTIAKMMENSSQSVKQVEAKNESIGLKNIIISNFTNPSSCHYTFNPIINAANITTLSGSPTAAIAVSSVKDKVNAILYNSASTNIKPLTITAMSLTNWSAANSTGDFVVNLTFRRSATQVQAVKPIKIKINFNISGSALVGCSPMEAGGGEWLLSGNAGTVPGTDYIGTADNVDLVFKRNNLETMLFTSTGSAEIGTDNAVLNTYAFAQGLENYVSGRYGFGAGYLNNVTAEAASALGKGNVASGINSHATGELNQASGLSSTAHGYYNLASGAYSFALGYNSTASGSSSTALGNTSVASGTNSLAGGSASASGVGSLAFGSGASAEYNGSIGLLGDSRATQSLALGSGATANGMFSVAVGRNALTGANGSPNSAAVGLYATAIGPFASATQNYALALSSGSSALASGTNSVAIGETVSALANRSVAMGLQAKASGTGSNMAIGGNLHQSHQGTMFGYNPWATTLSRGNFITTIFGPTIDLCTATNVANNGAPEYGSICQATASISISRTNNNPAADYPRVGIGYSSTTSTLAVNCTGNAGACATKNDGSNVWLVTSDRRLKTVEKDYKIGLKEILKIRPVYYRYKDNQELGFSSENLNIGIVAQELLPHIPDAIKKSPNGYLSFQADPVIWGTVNSIKELNTEMVKLKEENHQLKQALCELHPELKICQSKK